MLKYIAAMVLALVGAAIQLALFAVLKVL